MAENTGNDSHGGARDGADHPHDGKQAEKREDEDQGKDQGSDAGKGSGKGSGKDGDEHKGPGKKPLIILGVIVIVVAIVALVWWLMTRNQQTTDDAFTDGNAVTIAPKVSGYVQTLFVNDNTRVKKDAVLLQIDPRDFIAARDQAAAQLGLAQAQLESAKANLEIARVQYPAQRAQAVAQRESAEANLMQTQLALNRQHAVDPRATSAQNVDTATAQQRSARASVASAQAQVRVASLVDQNVRLAETAVHEREQQVRQALAQLEQAELNLSYTVVRAPSDGFVTRRNVQQGTLLQAGQSVFSLVTPDVWITANFKESQLVRMRIGDDVDIEVDAYPELALHGHVESIQQGTGSRFSAFPAENATGNYVKIVQRVPVKIVIDRGLDPNRPLPLGLSVEPKVYLK